MSTVFQPGAAPNEAGGEVPLTLVGTLRANVRQYGMLVALVLIVAIFQAWSGGIILAPQNVTNLVLQNSYIVIMALGMLLIIVVGHIDLSVGSVAAFTGAVAAVLMVNLKVEPLLAAALTLTVGGFIGAFQGYWVAYLKVPSFIVTLAGMLLFRGLTLVMLQGQPVGPFPEGFRALASGFIPNFLGTLDIMGEKVHITTMALGALICVGLVALDIRDRREQQKYGFSVSSPMLFIVKNLLIVGTVMFLSWRLAAYSGYPVVLVVMLVLTAVYWFMTLRTTLGRRIFAVGGNAKAAMLSGVNTSRYVFFTFVSMGVLAALGGLIVAARLNSSTPKAGTGFELDVIAACFIGGASAYGGVGTVIGAVIGAFVMGVLNNGMSIMGISIDWQQAVKGLVLLAAVFFDVRGRSREG
jgi:putative multiple sugar transport system permease protein